MLKYFMFKQDRRVIFFCLGLIFLTNQSIAQVDSANVEKAISIHLLTNKATIASGDQTPSDEQLLIGLQIATQASWHFYWAGIGTELLEPTILWNLPEGYSVEAVHHPKPSLFDYGGFMGYGYSGNTVFLYRLIKDNSVTKDYLPGDLLEVTATVDWVLCKDVCIFGSEKVSLSWAVSNRNIFTEEGLFLNSLLEGMKSKQNKTLENHFLEMGLLGWLCLAFLGGAILNLMPCVLPVLSIKVFSLIEHAKSGSSKRFFHGLMYSIGVILSFIVLAVVLIGLRSLGEEVGWGFQLQDPFFITFLIMLFFLLGLNMLGLFEIGSSLARLSKVPIYNRYDWLGSFVTGILAAVVGAPCVGPFIGGVSGIALQVDPGLGILIFAMIGFGMAFPFLILSWVPGLLRFLPKPGAWMVRFRQVMGVVLIFSTAFLIWVVNQSVGFDGVFQAFILLIFIFLGGYLLGRWGQISESKVAQRRARLASFVLIAFPAFIVGQHLNRLYDEAAFKDIVNEDGVWGKWSEPLVRAALDSGQGVFIDFTASWCLICQSNKALVFKKKKTEALFEKYGIRLFVADWTLNDPEITRALESYGRSGVPLYILKTPDGAEQILPQKLNYSLLETAVETLFSEE